MIESLSNIDEETNSMVFSPQSQAYAAPQIRQYQAAAPQPQQYSQSQGQQYKPTPKQAPRRPAYQSGGSNSGHQLTEEEEEEVDVR